MKKNSHKGSLLLFFSLATVVAIAASGFYVNTFAQSPTPTATEPSTSTPTATTKPAQKREETEQTKELKKQLAENQKEHQKALEGYRDQLLNTVLMSVLATVVAITLTFFGYQFFTSVIGRELDKRTIKAELEEELRTFIHNEIRNFEQRLAAKQSQIEIKLNWLEYQFRSLSAQQLENEQKPELSDSILKVRRHAINTLRTLQKSNQGILVEDCINSEIEAVKFFCSTLNSEIVQNNLELRKEISKIKEMIEKIPKEEVRDLDLIKARLNELIHT